MDANKSSCYALGALQFSVYTEWRVDISDTSQVEGVGCGARERGGGRLGTRTEKSVQQTLDTFTLSLLRRGNLPGEDLALLSFVNFELYVFSIT